MCFIADDGNTEEEVLKVFMIIVSSLKSIILIKKNTS